MFIAHLPAGFLLTRSLLQNERDDPAYVKYLLIGLVASIAPDFDLAYFYLIDHRQHPHHSYWTHIPFYWLAIYSFFSYPVYKYFGKRTFKLLTLVLFCGLLHMTLDSIASGIKWLYPFNQTYFGIWRIPAVYQWWVANYLFHWTFILELLITTTAAIVFIRDAALHRDIKYQCLLWVYKLRPGSSVMQKRVNLDSPTHRE